MFVLNVKYTADLDLIDQHLAAHRAYLDTYYTKGLLLCSGPKNPRNGGVIIGLFKSRSEVEDFIKHDPYTIYNLATYEVNEFSPVKHHAAIKELCA